MRTAKTTIGIRNNGVLVPGDFDTIDLLGTLTGANQGGGVVGITGSGGSSANIDTRVVAATQSGANITLDLTTLPHTFTGIEFVTRNGPVTTPVLDWSLSGNTITVFNADASEIFQVQYTY